VGVAVTASSQAAVVGRTGPNGGRPRRHLTRTVREHLGHTPTALHRILDPDVETPPVVADSVRAARSIGSRPSKSSLPPAAG